MAPRDLYAMLAAGKADIMLSGGRTQFIALKAKTPWLDINQERHHPYAGYDGMVELVRQIDLAIHNPVCADVRAPAPWDLPAEGQGRRLRRRRRVRRRIRARSSPRPPPTTWASAEMRATPTSAIADHPHDLVLRSPRSGRLEGPSGGRKYRSLASVLRDASPSAPRPQDEVPDR